MNLLIRADASAQIGTGHVMRGLALAQAWQDAGGCVTFLMSSGASALEERLKAEEMDVVHQSAQSGGADDARQTIELAKQVGAPWVIVDGYHFDATYQRQIKDAGHSLLFIDDYGHAEHYYADLVLNQNIYAGENFYVHREPHTQLLLGLRYALLRREFWTWRDWKREIAPHAHKILVTLGGSDPANATLRVIQALGQMAKDDMNGLETIVVAGGSNPHYDELRHTIQTLPLSIRLERSVTNMPELMAWADIAISAAGSTCWELAFMGLPTLATAIAENQRPIATGLEQIGATINLGWHESLSSTEIAQVLSPLLVDAEKRSEMSRRGRELVDGRGAERVYARLQSEKLTLREVREDDCRLLWEWANDPAVRAVSFSSQPISWEDHVEWFHSKINAPNHVIFIALDDEGTPVGQVRYTLEGNEAVISTSVAAHSRGRGFGSIMIHRADQKLFATLDVKVIHAYIKPDNDPSKRAFTSAGYFYLEQTPVQDQTASHYIRKR